MPEGDLPGRHQGSAAFPRTPSPLFVTPPPTSFFPTTSRPPSAATTTTTNSTPHFANNDFDNPNYTSSENLSPFAMPPVTRSAQRRPEPISPSAAANPVQRQASSDNPPGVPSPKRRRLNTRPGAASGDVTTTGTAAGRVTPGTSHSNLVRSEPVDIDTIDTIDLTGNESANAIAQTLQKQRADQIKSQLPPTEKPSTLGSIQCVICMDTPTDLTATSCGESSTLFPVNVSSSHCLLMSYRPFVLSHLPQRGPHCRGESVPNCWPGASKVEMSHMPKAHFSYQEK
jgi:hypothetical protein